MCVCVFVYGMHQNIKQSFLYNNKTNKQKKLNDVDLCCRLQLPFVSVGHCPRAV